MAQSTSAIQNLLERMNNSDKDFRFMATNDLMGELQHDNIRMDDDSELKITRQIVNLLEDKNGEVQNLAVKCLGLLVAKIKDDRRQIVIHSLCNMLKSASEQVRDIASIALKTIVTDIPINKRIIDIIDKELIPNLCIAVANQQDVNVQLESLEILTELINRVGAQIAQWHERVRDLLMNQLQSERAAVRKRTMNALSYLLSCCSEELFNNTIEVFIATLSELGSKLRTADFDTNGCNLQACNTSKTLLQALATITRSTGHRSTEDHLLQVMPVIHSFCQINDDELRENCLQAFEAYTKRCPVILSKSLDHIIQVCLSSLSHDPNYNYNYEDDMNDEAMDMDNGDEGSESDEDYSDDEDLSWKVRRASARCIEAIILSRPDMIDGFFVTIAPTLVSRFIEREDTVKADIIQTFVTLLKQVRQLIRDPKNSQTLPASSKLAEMVPLIIAKSSILLREKSIKTRQSVFHMFIEIMHILPDVFSCHMASLVPGILYSLADKNSSSNMKIDALLFVQELIKTHNPTSFYSHIQVLLPAVIAAMEDSFYRISSEALALLSLLVCVIRPRNYKPLNEYESVLSTIYEKTLEKMSKSDADIEIKERAIMCMGQIIATFGDKLTHQLPRAMEKLHEKLSVDATRLTCVKALIQVANAPIEISLNCLYPKAFATIGPFLRKSSRPLKISTLVLIENVVKRSDDLLDEASARSILADVPSLIGESDLYVSQLALTMLTTVLGSSKSSYQVMPQTVLTETLKLIRSPLLQGSSLKATLRFLATIVKKPNSGLDYRDLISKLVEPVYKGETIHKQAYHSTAKAIAEIIIDNKQHAFSTATQLVEDSKKHHDSDIIYTLILLALGEIGRVTDLSSVPSLVEVILQAFNSSSEDVKTAGSFALGCIAIGNLDKFLPIILHEIEARNRRQYLILHSLREVILAGKLDQLETIWTLLMKHCECQEEGTRNVVAECLGKLTLHRHEILLPRLVDCLKNTYKDHSLARATIVAAVKFTICDHPQAIDLMLSQCIGEFLFALQDSDINVRRVALITLNSAAHHKPALIADLLPQVLPLLYQETQVKSELIREVEMGPFKHKVDDGLDTRKAAFECMYTLLDTCQNKLDIFEFLTYVECGLTDHYDIKMLTYLMLNRLATMYPSAVLQRMDRLIKLIAEDCRTKLKDTAVKQEHEKQDELKRSALRVYSTLKSIPNADRHLALVKFHEDLIKGDKELSELYSAITQDSVSPANDVQEMDLS